MFGSGGTQNLTQGQGFFGNSQAQQQNNSGMFGGINSQNSNIGNNNANAGVLFGAAIGSQPTKKQHQNPNGNGLFGGNSNNTSNSAIFGNNNTNQSNPNNQGGLFGNQNKSGISSTSIFGSNQPNNLTIGNQLSGAKQSHVNLGGGGLFGNQTNQGGALFGGQQQAGTNQQYPFGLQSNQQQKQSGSSLFGNTLQVPSSNSQSQQQSGGLFVTKQQANTGGLFGTQQTTSFGGLAQNQTGINQTKQQQPQNFVTQSSVFGQNNPQPGNQHKPNSLGGTSWGVTTNQPDSKFLAIRSKNPKIDSKHLVKCIACYDSSSNKNQYRLRYLFTGDTGPKNPENTLQNQNQNVGNQSGLWGGKSTSPVTLSLNLNNQIGLGGNTMLGTNKNATGFATNPINTNTTVSNNNTGGLFGGQITGSFGNTFGNINQQLNNQNKNTSNSIFGGGNNNAPTLGSSNMTNTAGLFNPQKTQNIGGSIFGGQVGGQNSGGTLFQTSNNTSGSMPNNQNTGSLFGNHNTNNNQSNFTSTNNLQSQQQPQLQNMNQSTLFTPQFSNSCFQQPPNGQYYNQYSTPENLLTSSLQPLLNMQQNHNNTMLLNTISNFPNLVNTINSNPNLLNALTNLIPNSSSQNLQNSLLLPSKDPFSNFYDLNNSNPTKFQQNPNSSISSNFYQQDHKNELVEQYKRKKQYIDQMNIDTPLFSSNTKPQELLKRNNLQTPFSTLMQNISISASTHDKSNISKPNQRIYKKQEQLPQKVFYTDFKSIPEIDNNRSQDYQSQSKSRKYQQKHHTQRNETHKQKYIRNPKNYNVSNYSNSCTVSLDELPLTSNFTLKPSIKQLQQLTQYQIKKVYNVQISNQYGKINFIGPVNLYKKQLFNCIKIQQDCIQILIDEWQNKPCYLTYYNFGSYISQGQQQKRKIIKKMKKWITKNKLTLEQFDEDSGNLEVKVDPFMVKSQA